MAHVVPVAAPNPLIVVQVVALDEARHARVSHIVSLVLFAFENIKIIGTACFRILSNYDLQRRMWPCCRIFACTDRALSKPSPGMHTCPALLLLCRADLSGIELRSIQLRSIKPQTWWTKSSSWTFLAYSRASSKECPGTRWVSWDSSRRLDIDSKSRRNRRRVPSQDCEPVHGRPPFNST